MGLFDMFDTNKEKSKEQKREELRKKNPDLDPWQIDEILEGNYNEDDFEEEELDEDNYYYEELQDEDDNDYDEDEY